MQSKELCVHDVSYKFLYCTFVLGDVAETENLDRSQLGQSVVTEVAKQQVIVQYLKLCIIVFVYVPKHYECQSSEMYVCILQWLLKSLYARGFQADT